MAKTPEHDPEDLEDLDSLPEEPASEEGASEEGASERRASRRRGIPDGAEKRGAAVSDLSKPKEKLPAFQSQDRREARRSEGMDLEGETEETAGGKTARPPQKETAPVVPSRRDEPPAETVASAPSGREKEEELRREAGRPKFVRSSDFEPLAWASSETKLDLPEPDENGRVRPRPRLGACLWAAFHGLKTSWCRLKLVEMASVSVFLVVALLGLFVFRSLVLSGPQPAEEVRVGLDSLSMPLEGDLLTITSVEAYWREPQPGDIVRPGNVLVPEVRLQLASGSGFLRLLFRDEENKIQGDAVAEEVTNGKIEGKAEFVTLCSIGYKNPMHLVETRAGRQEPWTIHIYESGEYDVPIEEWRRLAQFDMPSTVATGGVE